MSEDTKKTDTYPVTHDFVTDFVTGGKGVEGPRESTSETHDGETVTRAVEHDPGTDALTGGEGVETKIISTTKAK